MQLDHKVTIFSPAKINTFLQVYNQRADGYHDILTHFQLVDLCDELIFSVNDTGVIRVYNPAISINEVDDLCYRAALSLKQHGEKYLGVNIFVNKNIPDGSGLGGGSSNAASVLMVLNKLWNLSLSKNKLLALGLALGSDVPFFIHGQSTLAKGRGEVFVSNSANNLIENKLVIIVKPNQRVLTREIFQSGLLTKRGDIGKICDLGTARLIQSGENDFASVVYRLYPSVYKAFKRLSDDYPAYLTGTGSCVYTVLDDDKKADKIIRDLSGDYKTFLVKAISESPLNRFK